MHILLEIALSSRGAWPGRRRDDVERRKGAWELRESNAGSCRPRVDEC